MILDSSMVEHTAVNRGVVGSSPTRGAEGLQVTAGFFSFAGTSLFMKKALKRFCFRAFVIYVIYSGMQSIAACSTGNPAA